ERFRLKRQGTVWRTCGIMKNSSSSPRQEANQTVRLEIGTKDGSSSIRISFTDQRLTAHGGMVIWSHHLKQRSIREQLREVLPHAPVSPNSYDPTDVALGYIGGIVCGADKLSRVAWLQSDPAIAEVLGIEAVASQSTFSRFFAVFKESDCNRLNRLHQKAIQALPSRSKGYTLDLDSWALLHEDGHQEGVRVGYTRLGLKPCHRPLVAGLAEPKMIAGYWLRRGDTACVNGAAEFLRQTVTSLPKHIRIGLVRADSGFGDSSVVESAEAFGLKYIFVARLTEKVQSLCRHDDAAWQKTELDGMEVQEVPWNRPGQRLIVVRQRMSQRPQAGGKELLEVPGYRFQAFITNLPDSLSALEVWRRYNGRADLENRIKELGEQFGMKRLCVSNFWGTEALHHLAILAYNLCVLLQRKLGQLELCQLNTLRWRLFSRAAVWSRAQGKATLKLAVEGEANRKWFCEILKKLTAFSDCNAVGSLQASTRARP
ncbi:MAG: transposase, family, partial [Verrucomicrobiales bacterium]|nr:transposase, family [Verrucomicrobiales bacterium]